MHLPPIRWPLRLLTFLLLGALVAELSWRLHGRGRDLQAGTAVRMSTEQLVAGADLIVEGWIRGAQALRQPDGVIDTDFELEVGTLLYGQAGGVERIRLPGGVLPDGSGMLLPGVDHPGVGTRVLWFLSAAGVAQRRMPIGLSQGSWRLLPTTAGGWVAQRAGAGVGLWDLESPHASQGSAVVLRPYADLLAEVEAAIGARRARESGR
jgi:hypothetical protein